MDTPINPERKATEYLANERTFLAWMRTCISVISLGFVVAKFSVWLRELAKRLDPQMSVHGPGMSMPIGVTMMAFGGLLAPLAAWHYHKVNIAISRGDVRPNRDLVVVVSGAIALLSLLMIAYMVMTAEHL